MTVNFYLKDAKADYDTWIYCLIRYGGNQVKVYTDKKIHPKFWNPLTQSVRQTVKYTNHSEFNLWLKDISSHVATIELDWKRQYRGKAVIPPIPKNILKEKVRTYLAKQTKEERNEAIKKSFWGYYDNFLFRMENGTRVHFEKGTPIAPKTIFQFHNLKRHLKNFEQKKGIQIDFENIDLKFYKRFVDYLTIDLILGPNTIGKLITNLKVFLKEALEEGLTANNIFTYRKFKAIKFNSDTVYLTNDEIKELQNLDLSNQGKLDKIRDMFIVGCYTGLRFSDLVNIKPENIIEGMIEVIQVKTGNQVIIPMAKEVEQILIKYNNTFPKISNQKFNEYLHDVCKRCDVLKKVVAIKMIKGGKIKLLEKLKYELVSSHTARRSFATNEFKAGDLEVSEIMAITGHKTEKAFYKYIRESPKEMANRIKEKFIEREIKRSNLNSHLKVV